jgi:hypothetical protein
MHAHFKMSNEKVERRIQVVEITQRYLEDFKAFKLAKFKDHLGDSLAFVLYYINVQLEDYIRNQKPNPFEKFKFKNKD